jgi:hypothetical protein
MTGISELVSGELNGRAYGKSWYAACLDFPGFATAQAVAGTLAKRRLGAS